MTVDITSDIIGSIAKQPGGFSVSVWHKPSGRTLYGFEKTYDGAMGWLEGSKLVFAKAERAS